MVEGTPGTLTQGGASGKSEGPAQAAQLGDWDTDAGVGQGQGLLNV